MTGEHPPAPVRLGPFKYHRALVNWLFLSTGGEPYLGCASERAHGRAKGPPGTGVPRMVRG
jgi:hypothetical protein